MIQTINVILADYLIYMLIFALFFLSILGIMICGNYIKKLICMNIMQVAVIFFFLCTAQEEDATIPILEEGIANPALYVNPLPHALMLTAIVVSLGTTGVAIALLMHIKETYGSVEESEILRRSDR